MAGVGVTTGRVNVGRGVQEKCKSRHAKYKQTNRLELQD